MYQGYIYIYIYKVHHLLASDLCIVIIHVVKLDTPVAVVFKNIYILCMDVTRIIFK